MNRHNDFYLRILFKRGNDAYQIRKFHVVYLELLDKKFQACSHLIISAFSVPFIEIGKYILLTSRKAYTKAITIDVLVSEDG